VTCYLRDLEYAFSDVAIFFYDRYGGEKIMGLWRGSNSSTWKTDAQFNFTHVEKTDVIKNINFKEPKVKKRKVQPMVKRNDDAIFSEIQRLGSGLIERVELIKLNQH
jgi:U3 small nucleolar RNA-associated protein 22